MIINEWKHGHTCVVLQYLWLIVSLNIDPCNRLIVFGNKFFLWQSLGLADGFITIVAW